MGGKTKTNTVQTTNQTQTQNSQQGSTATLAGDRAIPGLEAAFNEAVNTPRYGENGERFTVENGNWTGPTTAVAGTPGQSLVTDPNYTGPILAGPNAGQTGGAQGLINYGNSQVAPVQSAVNAGQNYFTGVLNGSLDNPETNPALQGMLKSIRDNAAIVNAQQINQFRDAAVEGGAYGGTGYGQQSAFMVGEQDRALNDQNAAILWQNYVESLRQKEGAGSQIANFSQMGTLPYQFMTQGGNQQNALDQIGIDNTRNTYEQTKANEQQTLDEAEWQRQQQYFIDQQNLVNQQGSFAGNVANQEDAIRESLMQYQSDIEGTYAPWEAYFNLLGQAPTTQFNNSTGTMSGTTNTSSVQSQQPSPWQIAAGIGGLGLTAATGGVGGGFWGKAAAGLGAANAAKGLLSSGGGGGDSAGQITQLMALNPFINTSPPKR